MTPLHRHVKVVTSGRGGGGKEAATLGLFVRVAAARRPVSSRVSKRSNEEKYTGTRWANGRRAESSTSEPTGGAGARSGVRLDINTRPVTDSAVPFWTGNEALSPMLAHSLPSGMCPDTC
ncbi:hypothetical protein EYF80_032594 [Liparis tanakae]|uniref:Uncharacterized protein n=1 Tax=Liparis tanakae TaxID=230148 RepID=A0A4Z2GX41_9TELE|nr:hypothetical protein EYF80_032594 [Liparis tanakae]